MRKENEKRKRFQRSLLNENVRDNRLNPSATIAENSVKLPHRVRPLSEEECQRQEQPVYYGNGSWDNGAYRELFNYGDDVTDYESYKALQRLRQSRY